jgi:hypothetical protein
VRPFREGTSSLARHAITPVMGSVGRGTTVEDHNYVNTAMVSNPNFIGLDVITGDDCVVPYIRTGDWKRVVEEMIKESDAMIVDVSELTDNLRWEIDTALSNLPPERVIFVACEGNFEPLRSHLAAVSRLDAWDTATMIPYRTAYLRRLVFRFRLWRAFQWMR